MTEPRLFNREKFLLFLLAGIFIWQAAIFSYGVVGCFQKGGMKACPDLGDRYESTVNVMVATTLALLGAGAVASVSQRKSSDPASPSASSLPQRPQLPPEVQTSSQEQSDPRRQSNSEPPVLPDRPRKGSGRKSARSQDRLED